MPPATCCDWKQALSRLTTLALLLIGGGCSSAPAGIAPPEVDPNSATARAMESFDANQDGTLSEAELAKCPPLKENLAKYDENGDESLSSVELRSGLEKLYSSGVGMFSLGCQVFMNNRPLRGATVKLVPAEFLGPALKKAYGATQDSGTALLSVMPEDIPEDLKTVQGVYTGLYRVEVTHPNIKIPGKYNAETELGREISPGLQASGIKIELSSAR